VSSQYERELRQVIAGVPAGVEAVIKSCTEQQKEKMRLAITRPFLVVRAAGSGMEGSGDLLALRGDICFPIEVKTTKASKLYLSGRTMAQYLAMVNEGQRCNLMPLYAHRRKGIRGDSWMIFRVETNNLKGRLRQLAKSIPPFPLNRNGTPYLNWDDGMPLHKFIALVCSNAAEQNQTLHNLEVRAIRTDVAAQLDISKIVEEQISGLDEIKNQTEIFAELARRRSR
jgi:Holliday junction resolvase|tara:strand:- start:1375 stop:2055 length:681 start_codon:yes stop_codon:yes gene_type:complete